MVHAAGSQERAGATPVLRALVPRFPGLAWLWAAGGDAGKRVPGGATVRQRTRVSGQRPRRPQGLQVRQGRWNVERTCGWLTRSRRLSQDFEALPESTETWIRITMIHLRVRRLAGRT